MPKISAKNGLIIIGGYHLSTQSASYELDAGVEPLEVTGFTEGWKNYIAGLYTGQMSINAYWDTTANTTVAALKSLGKKCVTVIPDGWVLGNPSITMYAEQENFTPGAAANAVLMSGNIRFSTSDPDGGPLLGVALQHGEITNTLTGTGFVDPSAGQVTKKCAGVLHIWTPTATDTYVIKIQHCDTINGVYADLIAFTLNGTARGSEMVKVASGDIEQYRRVLATRTGGGQTLGFTVSFWHAGMQ